jgi:tetratricopeptide (TPR) repeat protein
VRKPALTAVVLALAFAFLLPACSHVTPKKPFEASLVVPDCATPTEQFAYAKTYERSQLILPDSARRNQQLDNIIQCYEKVVTNFPSDQVFTPVSYLEMADCVSNKGDLSRAIGMYDAAMAKWPELEFVNARAMLSKGRIQDRMGRHSDAKQTYQDLRMRFKDTKSEKVRSITKAAETAYYKLQKEKTSAGSKKPGSILRSSR